MAGRTVRWDVVSGRGAFWINDLSNVADLARNPGGVRLLLSIGVPRHDPADIHFIDPADGTPDQFIAKLSPPNTQV